MKIAVEPAAAALDSVFVITLTNQSAGEFNFGCCDFPVITAITSQGDYRHRINCPRCDPSCEIELALEVLPPRGTLRHEWRPLDQRCIPGLPVAPGLYEVRWTGFPDHVATRVELLPAPTRQLEVIAEPPEARLGEEVRITLHNPTERGICLPGGGAGLPFSILDPRGFEAFCVGGPLCGPARCCRVLPPGESLAFSWAPGKDTCAQELLPGRYRVIGKDLLATPETYDAVTTVLVLPGLDRRLDFTLSATEVRWGETIRITATNPLDVPVWHETDCWDFPLFIDELGRDNFCSAADPCGPPRFEEIPPGDSITREFRVPSPADCPLDAGRWSVVWGDHNFFLVPDLDPGQRVFGYAEITVLPSSEDSFVRGDSNSDRAINVADAVHVLSFLFLGDPSPACPDAADVDDSGILEITDPIYLLGFLFLGTPPPPPPFPDPGLDPTGDRLHCLR